MSAPQILQTDLFSQWRTAINGIATAVDTLNTDVGDKTDISLPLEDRGSLVSAINTILTHFGDLSALTTTAKTDYVAAINEVDGHADTANTGIGTLSSLTTSTKTNLVGAINDVNAKTTATITDSTNKRYVTDAYLTVLSHTTNTNSGDQDVSGFVPTSRTVNTKELSSNVTLTTADIADSTNKRYVTDAYATVLSHTTNTNSGDESTTTIGGIINGATSKDTPVDADMVGLMDSAASNVLKKLSWANIKTMLNGLYAVLAGVAGGQTLTGGTASGNNLTFVSTSNATKGKILFGNSGYDEVNNRLGVGNSTPDQALTVTGTITATGFICSKVTSVTLSNGLNSNIAITSSYVRIIGPTASFSAGGFTNPSNGAMVTLYSTTSNAMTITNEDTSSTAANRIKTLTGADVVLAARTSSASFIYDSTDSRWILTGTN